MIVIKQSVTSAATWLRQLVQRKLAVVVLRTTPQDHARPVAVKGGAGFTLIELLVVIAIIGLLASVVLVSLNGARRKSRDAKRLSDIRQIASAMELYFNEANTYPSATSGLVPNFIGAWPTAPQPNDGGCSTTQNSYGYTGASASYSITFCLGAITGGYQSGPHTLTQSGIQ